MNSIPEGINKILEECFKLFELEVPNLVESYYIYGSVALGAFHNGLSDIDFIAVVKRQVTELDIDVLKEIYSNIKNGFLKTDLMGNDLKLEYENEKSCHCFRDGVYRVLKKFEEDSIDVFQLKKYELIV